MLQISKDQLEKLRLGCRPVDVCEAWDCATVIEGLASILWLILSEQEDWLIESEEE